MLPISDEDVPIRSSFPESWWFDDFTLGQVFLILTGDVARRLESRNSNPKTLGSIPWRGRVRNSVSVVQSHLFSGLDFFVVSRVQ